MEPNIPVDQFNLTALRQSAESLLTDNILAYWTTHTVDKTNGGFYGRISGSNVIEPTADKGAILNARILWTFSAAYRELKKPEYLEMATRAKAYLLQHFYHEADTGIYWSVDYTGKPKETKNQIYALSFAIYGLTEYHLATGNYESLLHAVNLFNAIETHSLDTDEGGYFEAFTSDWQPIADMRLSDKDANEKKTMNTHLHVLEAYTNLYRVWPDGQLKQQLHQLIVLFLEKIINKNTQHLNLFFDEKWQSKVAIISYGHDIEASWLLQEAAEVLGDQALLERVKAMVPGMVKAASEGMQENGGLIYEYNTETDHTDKDIHWWVQAEAVVGYLNLYQHFNDQTALQHLKQSWSYLNANLVDNQYGEWYWSIDADGRINTTDDKAGFWKCPYHNGRMCLEILKRSRHEQIKSS